MFARRCFGFSSRNPCLLVCSRRFEQTIGGNPSCRRQQSPSGVESTENASPLSGDVLGKYAKLHWDDSITRDDPEVQRLKKELLEGSRAALASAITLVESKNPTKRARGNHLLSEILAVERQKLAQQGTDALIFRIGISGSPGVGKSTFIEALGMELIEKHGKKVAVLTVDPTSQTTGGSILGDLTRMNELSRNPRAYIRQSPTSGSLGGVTRGIHEAVILCEGAGYDVVLIETVGVGQSEISVAGMVDLFCLLVGPGHGDELQGVKRGVMELSDLLVVTKSDGELEPKAKITQADYISALKYLRPRKEHWKPKVLRASVFKPDTVAQVWDAMEEFRVIATKNGALLAGRNEQLTMWMWNHVKDELMNVFQHHPDVVKKAPFLEREVRRGLRTPGLAAEVLIRTFFGL
uniref:Uncharacterized protein n=1 Tax=Plectus sambesii TaxID=2011161 RepID=A0A914UZG9_9BILA